TFDTIEQMGFDIGIDHTSASQIRSHEDGPPPPGPAKCGRRSLNSDAASHRRVGIVSIGNGARLGPKCARRALSDGFDIFLVNSAGSRQRIADSRNCRVVENKGVASNYV